MTDIDDAGRLVGFYSRLVVAEKRFPGLAVAWDVRANGLGWSSAEYKANAFAWFVAGWEERDRRRVDAAVDRRPLPATAPARTTYAAPRPDETREG